MDEIGAGAKNAIDEGNGVQRGAQFEGNVRISDEVIVELAKKTITGIQNIQLANMGLVSKFGIGRKSGDSIRVTSVEDGKIPATTVDVYIRTKYGHRIPDLVWDIQEKVKGNLERYTGYIVTAVNVNVQGIYADDPKELSEETQEEETPAPSSSAQENAEGSVVLSKSDAPKNAAKESAARKSAAARESVQPAGEE